MFWFLLSFILIYIMVLSFHYQRYKIDPNEYNHQVITLLEFFVSPMSRIILNTLFCFYFISLLSIFSLGNNAIYIQIFPT